jgi:glycerol-3-phosphate acyltransferase PlsY
VDDPALVALAAVVAYFIGTFPTAVLVTGLATRGRVDIHSVGSGNPGGFNTMRSVGRAWGVTVIVVDLCKAVLATLAGWAIGGEPGAYAAATACVLGHIFPVWFRFRGGKGVAAAAGAVAVAFPPYFGIGAVVLALGALLTHSTERSAQLAGGGWVLCALVWWGFDLSNLWGPEPAAGMVVFAAVSTVVILAKFRMSRTPATPADAPPWSPAA